MGCLLPFLPFKSIQIIPLWCTLRTRKLKEPTQIFGNVRCPILGKPNTPLCGLADRHRRKVYLNWKLKISNTADNADITQTQARDRPPKLTAPEMISRSRDMVRVHQNLNGTGDLTTPLSGMVCHPWASTYYDKPIYQIWSLSPPTTKI